MAPEKKSNSTTQEKLRNFNLSGLKNSHEGQDHLVFLVQPESLKLKGVNSNAKHKFLRGLEQLPEGDSFFKGLIHPDDLLKFKSTLYHIEKTDSDNEHFLEIRIKTSAVWKSYQFEIRAYRTRLPSSGVISPTTSNSVKLTDQWETASKSNDQGNTHATGEEDQTHTCVLCIGREHAMGRDSGPKDKYLPKTENILAENQNKYLSLISSIDEGYASIDLIFNSYGEPFDFLFVETNPALENYLAFSQPEGYTIKELVPQFENYWLDQYASVALTGTSKRFNNYSESHSKNWLNVFAFPIGNYQNRRIGIIFSNSKKIKNAARNLKGMNESLEQKIEQRTDDLRENTQLLQMVFDTTNEGILVLEPIRSPQGIIEDFKYLRANKVMRELQGVSSLKGKRYLDVNPHAATNGLLAIFLEIMNKGGYKDFEFWCENQNLPGRWYRITARKQHELLISSMEDITDRKLEAKKLKENIRFKKQLAETSPDLIMIFDLKKEDIKYLNRDLSARPGMRKREVLGKKILEIFSLVHPREREKLLAFHDTIISGTNVQITNTEFRLRGTDKEWEWYSAAGKIFKRSSHGKVLEYLILLRNIEDQKITQKALLRAEKLSIKGEVARTFAHELRNPLASIGMATDILKKNLSEDQRPQLENYLEIIRRSTKVLNLLVTDLLTSSNYTQVLLQKTCLAEILEETLNLAGDRIYLTGIKVVKDYKGPCFINADKEKLKIALLNIIINASEAMHPDQGILRLRIEKDHDWYNLKIKDNGHGMEKDQLSKLFDAFYTQKPDGIGVGLTSVKSILEEHDAEIRVSSMPKKGTQFELLFHCHELLEEDL